MHPLTGLLAGEPLDRPPPSIRQAVRTGRAMGAAAAWRRALLCLALVVLVATARTAAAVGDGGGTGNGEAATTEDQQVLRLWSSSSSAAAANDEDDGQADDQGRFDWEWEDDEDQDDEDDEEEEEEEHVMAVQGKKGVCRNVVNVESFGAAGDGDADDTQAFSSAWKKACSLDNAVFLVPAGRRYKVGAIQFVGPCKDNRIIIQIQGTIVAPEEPSEWDPRSPRLWLLFSGLAGARIQGGGVIDGSGSKWWANSCKINKSNPCRGAPTAVTIDSCRGVRVRGLRVQNAQQMHVTVSRSHGVRVSGLRIAAPEDSPNTDGIHVAESTAVTIQSCRIGTGDDCVSIVNGSFGVKMRNIDCGPGHGISIGSLGKGGAFAAVADVALDGARIGRGAQNGVRIKTWQGGAGYVRGVRFADVVMDGVDHPIVIDQFYCDVPPGADRRSQCANRSSAVAVSDVSYRNISGTSRRAEAIRFACSDAVPCTGIVLRDIDLRRDEDDGGEVQTVCNCAVGFDYGRVQPAADCLRSSTCGGAPDDHHHHDEEDDEQGKDEAVLHTEL